MTRLLQIVLVLIGLLGILSLSAYGYLRSSLPQVEGRLELPLSAPTDIIRDEHGVPHIYAQSPQDAYVALGVVHAQDRLWQMEFQRRVGAGRLSEVLGEATLGTDKFLRTLGVYHYVEATVANLDPETLLVLESYVAGINSYLETRRGALPPEFLVLRFEPEPWSVADVLVWAKMMAWDLSGNWDDELLRSRLTSVLDSGQISELWPLYPGDAPVTLPDFSALYKGLPLDELWASSPKPEPPSSGSNNWVLSGEKSETGLPLLANDPHLSMRAPSLWYFAHLSAPGLDVVGATLPGVPAVLLGRNETIAWGFTNTGSDVQDLFIEELNPENENEYRTPDGFEAFELREETIKVKGQDDVTMQVRTTRHGPVISDANAAAQDAADTEATGGERILSFAWPILDENDLTVQATLNMNRAANWEDFKSALRDFWGAQQNIVYADVDGNIGYYAPARVPIRAAGDGSVPVPGWTGEYDWTGYIPFEDLPHAYNPASGQIMNANHKVIPDDYSYFLTNDWAEPYRAERIDTLLAERDTHSLDSMAAIQMDQHSLMVELFAPYLSELETATPVQESALELLTAFTGDMSQDSAAPLIFSAWYRELGKLIYADELGAVFEDYYGFRPLFVQAALQGETQTDWCDDVGSAVIETCDELVGAAFENAVAYLEENHGAPETWNWGKVHYAHSAHTVFTDTPLARFFDLKIPTGGDAFTVNAARFPVAEESEPFRMTHGPGYRALYDLSDLNNSLYIHTTGQSGNPLSRHYRSFVEPWRDGEYIPMLTNREEVLKNALGTLTLTPQ